MLKAHGSSFRESFRNGQDFSPNCEIRILSDPFGSLPPNDIWAATIQPDGGAPHVAWETSSADGAKSQDQ